MYVADANYDFFVLKKKKCDLELNLLNLQKCIELETCAEYIQRIDIAAKISVRRAVQRHKARPFEF